jgi:hypothetical protein
VAIWADGHRVLDGAIAAIRKANAVMDFEIRGAVRGTSERGWLTAQFTLATRPEQDLGHHVSVPVEYDDGCCPKLGLLGACVRRVFLASGSRLRALRISRAKVRSICAADSVS